MGPTPAPLPQAYGCTPTARSGQKTGKEKTGKKENGEVKLEHFWSLQIHMLQGTLPQDMQQ